MDEVKTLLDEAAAAERGQGRAQRWAWLLDGLDNIDNVDKNVDASRVVDGLYLGGLGAARDVVWLRNSGITHVLTVMQDWLLARIEADSKQKIKRKCVRICDDFRADIRRFFNPCFRWIERAIGGGGAVLVHCHRGVSRSATIVCSYLMRKSGLPADQALTLLKERRLCVKPNDGFVAQLRAFETECTHGSSKRRSSAIVRVLCSPPIRLPYRLAAIAAALARNPEKIKSRKLNLRKFATRVRCRRRAPKGLEEQR